MHVGGPAQLAQGQRGGEDSHALTQAEMPRHGHGLHGSADLATTGTPGPNVVTGLNTVLAAKPRGGANIYGPQSVNTALHRAAVSVSGGGQPHENRQPLLALNFIIAIQGIFPSRS